MTDTTAVEAPALPDLKPLHKAFLTEITGQVSAANEAAGALAAADGNDATLTEAIVAEADPASDLGKTISKEQKLLDALSDIKAAKETLIAEALKERKSATGEVDVEALKAAYDSAKKDATASLKMLKTLLGKEYDDTTVDRILNTVPDIAGARKSSVSSGGTGGVRVRGYSFFVDGSGPITMSVATKDKDGNKTTVERSNLAAVANFLSSEDNDVEQETLREAFLAAAPGFSATNRPDEVNFTALNGEGTSVNIRAVRDKVSTDNGADVKVESA